MEYFTFDKINQMTLANQLYILDCGIDDYQMIGMNRDFHELLTNEKIEHLYIASLGGHDPKYWNRSLSNQLVLFENYFNQ